MTKKLLLILSMVIVSGAEAQQKIFTWTDDAGITHYSDKPRSQDAKPAKLPPIMRGEVKLSTVKLESCDSHGGVNCQSGPDSDGSVICYDGYKGASARFRFNCQTAKLELNDIGSIQDDGSVKVFVRNSKSVKANEVSITYEGINGTKAKLSGPKSIEPLEVAEYTFTPSGNVVLTAKPTIAELTLACQNCP